MVIEGSKWGSKMVMQMKDLKQQIEAAVSNTKNTILNKLTQQTQKNHQRLIVDLIHDNLDKMSDTLAQDLKEAYANEVACFGQTVGVFLEQGF